MSLVSKLRAQIRWLRRSSAIRLTLLLSLLFAAGFAVAILVALTLGQGAIERRIDATLLALAGSSEVADGRNDSGAVIFRALDDLSGLPAPFARAVARGGGTVELQHDLWRSEVWRVLVTADSNRVPVMVAVPLDDSEQAQELLAGVLWTTAAIVISATLLLGLGAGFLAQRRLRKLDDTLAKLEQGDLAARTGQHNARDDLDDIARQLDHTAAALERLVNQTRNLSASIAHDLRTPLARLQAKLEMLPDGDDKADALEEAARLSAIFDTIMRVARIEAGQGRDGFTDINLADFASEMAETFAPVVEDAGKQLHVHLNAPAVIEADRQMLVQAIANLIQNALVHGGSEMTVFVDRTKLGVADNGAGVDPAQFGEIVKPLVRLDAARTSDGSGLGLALVRAVADRHKAQLRLSRNTPTGLKVTLDFTKL